MIDRPGGRAAAEQSALHRVAAFMARGAKSESVFAVVAEEVVALFGADIVAIVRHEPDGDMTVMSVTGFRASSRDSASGPATAEPVSRSAARRPRPVRRNDPASAYAFPGMRLEEARCAVVVPIVGEGHVWGRIGVGSRRGRLAPDTGQRLVSFTELDE